MIVLAGTGREVTSAAAKPAGETGGHPQAGGSIRDVETFAEDHCLPAIQANALVFDLAWPLVARRLAERTLWSYVLEPGDRWRFPAEGEFLAPDELTVTFDRGVPVAVDGETVSVAEALRRLNRRVAAQGAGKHRTEDGRTFAAPGALALVTAHRALERATLEPGLARFKRQVDREWATLVRDGQWFSPLKHALDSFVVDAQETATGDVRLLLHGDRVTALEPRADQPAAGHLTRPGRITAQA
jgi:argininosuccinate synthase